MLSIRRDSGHQNLGPASTGAPWTPVPPSRTAGHKVWDGCHGVCAGSRAADKLRCRSLHCNMPRHLNYLVRSLLLDTCAI